VILLVFRRWALALALALAAGTKHLADVQGSG